MATPIQAADEYLAAAWRWFWSGQGGPGVELLIALVATFAGVLGALKLTERQRRDEEREEFGRLIEAVLIESAANQAALGAIAEASDVMALSLARIRLDSLRLALTTERVIGHAPYSLTIAMSRVYEALRIFENFSGQIETRVLNRLAVFRPSFVEHGIRARACRRRVLEVLQKAIGDLPADMRARVVMDAQAEAVRTKLAEIDEAETSELDAAKRRPADDAPPSPRSG